MSDVEVAVDAGNYLGETPLWCAGEDALWWINCEDPPQLHRWHPASGRHDVWPMPQRIGGVARCAGGGMLVALGDGLYDFDAGTGALSLRVPSPFPPHVKLHECATDRQGRFWIGGIDKRYPADRNAADAAILLLNGDRLVPIITGISVANGLAVSPDGRTLYFADSGERRVRACDLDPATGGLSGERTFLELPPDDGFIDGATVDSEGGYWLANVAASALRRYRPDGTLDRVVPLPFSNPTKPAFGGPDLATLYVTSTRMPLPGSLVTEQENGPVFAVQTGFRGIVEADFSGHPA